jgi:hypothetical protein
LVLIFNGKYQHTFGLPVQSDVGSGAFGRHGEASVGRTEVRLGLGWIFFTLSGRRTRDMR